MSDAFTSRRAEGSTPRAELLRTTMVVRWEGKQLHQKRVSLSNIH